jgi:hypothetical protein
LLLRFPSEDAQHRRATAQVALANYDATVANYRQSTRTVPGNRDDGDVDFGKMSVGGRRIITLLIKRISSARTMNVYGRPNSRIGPGNDRTGNSDQLGPHEVLTHIVQLNPEEMEGRLTRVYEPNLTTTVANIEHIESTTVNGEAIVKIFPATERQPGDGERPGYGNFADHLAPAAARNPATALIISYSASSVPILLGLMPGTFGAAARNANNPPGSSPRNRALYGLRLI